jgi:DGQHR domain-containing protein
MIQVPALKINQKGIEIFVTALPFRDLRGHVKVDYWTPDNEEGYQRPLVDRRLAEVARFVLQDEGVLPTSILLCVRQEDLEGVRFERLHVDGESAAVGNLVIPDGLTLWIVDGQHRYFGVNRGFERDGAAELLDYAFPVSIMTGIDRYAEMNHFNIINTTQRKMSTDIVDRHLVMRAEREGLQMIAKGKAGERDYMRAKATRIVDFLNEEPGPWKNQVSIPGVVGRDKGLIRQHAMVASLEAALKDAWLSTLSDEDFAKLLARYWQALANVWPDAFATPDEYRVQATIGVYSLNLVFPSVIQLCLAERDLSDKKMADLWAGAGYDSSFWSKESRDPLMLGTGMASIRALAELLRGSLPKTRPVAI